MPYRQKHTWIFGGPQKGWSESYYIEDVTPTVAAGHALADQVAIVRAQLLGTGLFIKAIRVQEVEDAGGNKLKFQGDTFQGTRYPGSTGEAAAQADLSLLIDHQATGGGRHRLGYLGGFWDRISQNFGVYVNSDGPWNTAFAAWKAKILEFGYGWVSRTPSIDFAITGFTSDDTSQVTYTTAGLPFAGLGDAPFLINVHGLLAIGGKSVLNGNQMVTRITDNSCRTVGRYASGAFVGGGYINTFTYAFREIADLAVEKVVSRERGAPLLESPGRRPARRRT